MLRGESRTYHDRDHARVKSSVAPTREPLESNPQSARRQFRGRESTDRENIEQGGRRAMDITTLAVAAVAALHVGFFVLESVLWTTPQVRRVFGTKEQEAQDTKVLALNQGFYNLGAAALLMAFVVLNNPTGVMGVLLFLSAMGVVGAVTANWRIILIQTVPALAAFGLTYLN